MLKENVCPQTRFVEGSNYVDVNFKIDPRTNRLIMMGAMDNLVKGAAGQAVQNMNLMFGLETIPGFPWFRPSPEREAERAVSSAKPSCVHVLQEEDIDMMKIQKAAYTAQRAFRQRQSRVSNTKAVPIWPWSTAEVPAVRPEPLPAIW